MTDEVLFSDDEREELFRRLITGYKRDSFDEDAARVFVAAHVIPGLPDECWYWRNLRGQIVTSRRPKMTFRDRYMHVAKVIVWLRDGPLLDAYHYACHTCNNDPCVNERHLYKGTAKSNRLDIIRDPLKGKAKRAYLDHYGK